MRGSLLVYGLLKERFMSVPCDSELFTVSPSYVAASSLLTGRFPFKLEATKTNFAYFWTLEGAHLDYTMIPQELKGVGYSTHMVGKWYLHLPFFIFNSFQP